MFEKITIIILSAFLLVSCADQLFDYEECVQIENARCSLREYCAGNTEVKNDGTFNENFPDFDYDTCVSYAQEHCRTRQIKNKSACVGSFQSCVDSCADAINSLKDLPGCKSLTKNVSETDSLPECRFLKPADPDAGDAG